MSENESSDTVFPSEPPKTLVILVHGAWHGAWCWAALQNELDARGIASLAVDLPGHGASTLPLGDMYGDAQYVVDIAAKIGGPVVLVGHSYGGGVITEAAHRLRAHPHVQVRHLVYLTAFCVDEGESVGGLAAALPRQDTLLAAAILPGPTMANGVATFVVDCDKARDAFYGQCSAEMSAAAVQRLSPQPMATFGQPATGAAWKLIASTYVVCERDEAIHPSHQRMMAQRCGTVYSLDTDHSPFASMPQETANIIASIRG